MFQNILNPSPAILYCIYSFKYFKHINILNPSPVLYLSIYNQILLKLISLNYLNKKVLLNDTKKKEKTC